MSNTLQAKAVVLLSGGLDSMTALAVARQNFDCYALSFDYGQRSRIELDAAQQIAALMQVSEHRIVTLDLAALGGSALTDERIAMPDASTDGTGEHIPVTYVPARNTIFLSYALAWAEVLDAQAIFIGVNAVDFSGYPDCRPDYIHAFQNMANLATKQAVQGQPLRIHTPLIDLKKEEIIRLGTQLGVDYSLSISCYRATSTGEACGQCDSCRLRREGFTRAGIEDPTRYLQEG